MPSKVGDSLLKKREKKKELDIHRISQRKFLKSEPHPTSFYSVGSCKVVLSDNFSNYDIMFLGIDVIHTPKEVLPVFGKLSNIVGSLK